MNGNKKSLKRAIKKIGCGIVAVALMVGSLAPMAFAETEDTIKKEIVTVGYYLLDGYQEKDERGVFSGYGYDYLKEVSQFTKWEYDFVTAGFVDCIRMLEAGEVDIVGGVDKNVLKSNNIIFSASSNRSSKVGLFAKADNDSISFEDFEAFQGMRVGLIENDYQEVYLDEYCREHQLKIEKVYYSHIQALEDALDLGRVDAIYLAAEAESRDEKIIAKMVERPLYYAVHKDKAYLLEDLDAALQNIRNSNPTYDMQILNKHFAGNTMAKPSFTEKELEYIQSKGVVKVSYDMGWPPIEYYNEETGQIEGVTKDVFDLLAEKTGLEFEFVKGESLDEALQMVKNGETDMISFVSHDYETSDKRGIYTSAICMNIPLVGVVAKDKTIEELKVVAMPKGYYLEVLKNYIIKEYETVEDCFEAVNKGEAEATIANSYAANYYLTNPKYQNLIRQDLIGYSEDLAMGVSQKEDIVLLNIINKGLRCISDAELSSIVLSNYVVDEEGLLQELYYASPVMFMLCIGLMIAIGVVVFLYIIIPKGKTKDVK